MWNKHSTYILALSFPFVSIILPRSSYFVNLYSALQTDDRLMAVTLRVFSVFNDYAQKHPRREASRA